jgi:hypothetical protein
MKIYFKNREELVQYVSDRLQSLRQGSVLTMTIIPGQFEDFSARIVTEELSVDTVEKKEPTTSLPPTNI